MDDRRFSERHGFAAPPAEITVRHDAPPDLRGLVVDFACGAGLAPKTLRGIVCHLLMTRPDDNNWSDVNVISEVHGLVDNCEWFEVYDIIEAVWAALWRGEGRSLYESGHEQFAANVNAYFVRKGIGWQLHEGRIEVRGPEIFEAVVRPAGERLTGAGLPTAAGEIHEALRDLARRPEPDVTGAIQHAMAALECVARLAVGDPRATLGEILARYPGLVPRPLDVALEKAWGYASEIGRHLREGRVPSYDEAELVVMTSAATATYLERKLSNHRREPRV
jgi:hypothetical protein